TVLLSTANTTPHACGVWVRRRCATPHSPSTCTHAVDRSLRGVEVSTRAGGRELSGSALEPLWACAEELGAVAFVHPWGCTIGDRLDVGYLSNSVGEPGPSPRSRGARRPPAARPPSRTKPARRPSPTRRANGCCAGSCQKRCSKPGCTAA